MPRSLERYTAKYWEKAAGRRSMLIECAHALDEVVKPTSVVDIGCGPGWMIEHWIANKPEVRVNGFDKLACQMREHARPGVGDRIYRTDIDKWRVESQGGRFDLAICVNVHVDIEERDHEILARGLVALAPVVFFARSSPAWVNLFRIAEGYQPSPGLLKQWREALTCSGWSGRMLRGKAQFFVRPE